MFDTIDLKSSRSYEAVEISQWQGIPFKGDALISISSDTAFGFTPRVTVHTVLNPADISLVQIDTGVGSVEINRESDNSWLVSSTQDVVATLVGVPEYTSGLISQDNYYSLNRASNTLVIEIINPNSVSYSLKPMDLLVEQFSNYKDVFNVEEKTNSGSSIATYAMNSLVAPFMRDPRREISSARSGFYSSRSENAARINGLVQQVKKVHLKEELDLLEQWAMMIVDLR